MGKEGKAALKQRNMYPEWRFRVHVGRTCTRKAVFGYLSGKEAPVASAAQRGGFPEKDHENRADAIIWRAELLRRREAVPKDKESTLFDSFFIQLIVRLH